LARGKKLSNVALMKAISLREPKHFERIEIPETGEPGSGEALVQVHRVGVCGTDISGYLGKMPFFSYPRIPGHELGVEVLAVGGGVSNVGPGDRCSVEPYINDENSFASLRGRPNCCEKLRVLGVHTDGGLRPRFILPARKLHPSARLEWEQLALVETLAIGCHCVDRAAPLPQENLLLIGAGPIGLSVLEFARLAKARTIVLDMNQQRLDFCRDKMGVEQTLVFESEDKTIASLRELTDGNLPTIVIDATGSAASMSSAFQYVAHTGRLVYVGITTDTIQFKHPLLHAREMSVMGSRNALPGDFTRIISLIESGQIDTRPWITHRTAFDDMIGDFPSFTKPETGVIKAIVDLDA
jgi:2-desacetyl-2-hydroxyethyl bacteriochlorophyllide A dehydrogenase